MILLQKVNFDISPPGPPRSTLPPGGFYHKHKRTLPSRFSIPLLGADISVQFQISYRPFHCRFGQRQIFCNTPFGWPAYAVRICSIYKIHIYCYGSARQVATIYRVKIVQPVTSSSETLARSFTPSDLEVAFLLFSTFPLV